MLIWLKKVKHNTELIFYLTFLGCSIYTYIPTIVKAGEYDTKLSKSGTTLLVYSGYTYGLQKIKDAKCQNMYRCTRHSTKCLARAKLNLDNSLELRNGHNHPPAGHVNLYKY